MAQWFNKKDAAKYAGISLPTLDEWIADGLYHRKLGKRYFLRADEIDNFIDEHGDSESDVAKIVNGLFKKN